jgi:hypothetical protein
MKILFLKLQSFFSMLTTGKIQFLNYLSAGKIGVIDLSIKGAPNLTRIKRRDRINLYF